MIENNISMEEVEEIEYQPIQIEEKSNMKNMFDDNWYKMHPEKILGIPYEASGRFGKVIKYSGGVEVLDKIEVDEDFIGNTKILNDPLASVTNEINISAELQNPEVSKFVNEVITKSFDEVKTKEKLSKVQVEEESLVTPIPELNTFDIHSETLTPK